MFAEFRLYREDEQGKGNAKLEVHVGTHVPLSTPDRPVFVERSSEFTGVTVAQVSGGLVSGFGHLVVKREMVRRCQPIADIMGHPSGFKGGPDRVAGAQTFHQ